MQTREEKRQNMEENIATMEENIATVEETITDMQTVEVLINETNETYNMNLYAYKIGNVVTAYISTTKLATALASGDAIVLFNIGYEVPTNLNMLAFTVNGTYQLIQVNTSGKIYRANGEAMEVGDQLRTFFSFLVL